MGQKCRNPVFFGKMTEERCPQCASTSAGVSFTRSSMVMASACSAPAANLRMSWDSSASCWSRGVSVSSSRWKKPADGSRRTGPAGGSGSPSLPGRGLLSEHKSGRGQTAVCQAENGPSGENLSERGEKHLEPAGMVCYNYPVIVGPFPGRKGNLLPPGGELGRRQSAAGPAGALARASRNFEGDVKSYEIRNRNKLAFFHISIYSYISP